MKKLRMIVTSVIVLAIVGSAFAFNSKKLLAFCIDSDTTSGTASRCDQTLTGKFIDLTNGAIKYYYIGWDGNTSSCTTTTNTNCPADAAHTVKLSTGNS